MTRTRITLSAAACLALLAGAAEAQFANLNQPATITAPDPRTLPEMRFEATEHNFGTIFDDQKAQVRINFHNPGPGTLEIREWRGSCSCTVSTLHREGEDPANPAGAKLPDGTLPTVIFQPGERGWVDVEFDPHGKTGMQNQTVTFVTNDPRQPTPLYRITANVLPLVFVEPAVVNFNQVVKGQPAVLDVYITGRTEDFEATAATVQGNEYMTVEIHETVWMVKNSQGMWVPESELSDPVMLPLPDGTSAARKDAPEGQPEAEHTHAAGDGHDHAQPSDGALPIVPAPEGTERLRRTRVSVHLAPDAPPGRLIGGLSIRHNDPRREAIQVTLAGEVVGDVAVIPQRLAIGIQQAETMFERRFQVLSRSGVGFRITKIEEISNLPDTHKFNIQWAAINDGPNQGYIVTLRGKFPATLAQVQGEFRVHTTLDTEAMISVPFFGHVQGAR